MYAALYATAAAMLASRAYAAGSAIVVNGCSYPVNMQNTPSDDGVHTAISKTLQPGDTYSQEYTLLNNKMGWAIKLSKDDQFNSNIMQYEYTFLNDGTIWYDLSGVNGNPWNGNWLLQAQGGHAQNLKDNPNAGPCTPQQTYYRCDTDDKYGEQSCSDDATITVTLCAAQSSNQNILDAMKSLASKEPAPSAPCAVAAPSIGGGGGVASAATSAIAAVTSAVANAIAPAAVAPTTSAKAAAPTTTTTPAAAPTSSTKAQTSATAQHTQGGNNHHQNDAVVQAPTTFATSTTAAVVDSDGHVVTEVVTVMETALAYTTVGHQARHVHHPHQGQY